MILQVIEQRLVYLCHIAHPKRVFSDGDIEGQTVAHGRHIARISKENIVVTMLEFKHLIVALTKGWRESNANDIYIF